MATIGSMLWVCTDCIIVLANDDTSGIPADQLEDFLARFAAGIDREVGPNNYGHVVPGGSHSDGCDNDGESDCDCEHDAFSRGSCDLCRDHLAGARHAATVIYSR